MALLKKYEQAEFTEPPIPLGQSGVLHGRKWTVVGFLQRFVEEDDTRYFWDEYLLLEESTGSYGWLTCDVEGWRFGEALDAVPEVRGKTAVWDKEKYQLTEQGNAVTDYVLGEFNWRVIQGDRAYYQTYKRAEEILSMERTPSEVSWSRLEQISPATLSEAFKIKVPAAGGGSGFAGLSMPASNLASAATVGDAISTPFKAKGFGLGIFFIILVILLFSWIFSRNNCDPRVENCSSSSYSRGYSSGYSSGGGSHK